MPIPKLKMIKSDIEIAIAQAFSRNFKKLEFERSTLFIEIDKSMPPRFFLDETFEGCKEYPFHGKCKLCTQEDHGYIVSLIYDVSGRVLISECDCSPEIEFVGKLRAIRF